MDFETKSMRRNRATRSAMNYFVSGLCILATILVILPLIAILFYLIYKGASSLNLAFFTHVPAPVGETGGGMANSIVGSGIILFLASLMGIPIGIAAGVYLAEFGRGKTLANAIRFTADVLNGVPSIVMGISIYSLIVVQQKHFSALAGGVALAIMMVPTITRTTEEMLATVPHAAGVNNHQGSRATADPALMDAVMRALAPRHLFFIDSRTTAATVAYDTAERDGVRAAWRKVFLDDVATRPAVLKQLRLAVHDAQKQGWAIAIGHPHPATIAALAESLPHLEAQGILLVLASDVTH